MSERRCPSCEEPNGAEARFCVGCGCSLAEAEAAAATASPEEGDAPGDPEVAPPAGLPKEDETLRLRPEELEALRGAEFGSGAPAAKAEGPPATSERAAGPAAPPEGTGDGGRKKGGWLKPKASPPPGEAVEPTPSSPEDEAASPAAPGATHFLRRGEEAGEPEERRSGNRPTGLSHFQPIPASEAVLKGTTPPVSRALTQSIYRPRPVSEPESGDSEADQDSGASGPYSSKSRSTPVPSSPTPGPGIVLNARYELLQPLGKGGMGEVWKAHDQVVGEDVAVKLMHAKLLAGPEAKQMFYREGRLARSLSHPNIIRTMNIEVEGSVAFIVMELLEGQNLRDWLGKRLGRVPKSMIGDIGAQILSALEEAAPTGIVHRDIKPENIWLTQGGRGLRVKVMDFGLAKLAPGFGQGQSSVYVAGTPGYWSPEQVHDPRRVDQRSDLYTVGVVLHELATGKLPINGRLANDVPGYFKAFLEKSLETSASDRWQSAREMREALLRATHGSDSSPMGDSSGGLGPSNRHGPASGFGTAAQSPSPPRATPSPGGGAGGGAASPPRPPSAFGPASPPSGPGRPEPGRSPTSPVRRSEVRRTGSPRPASSEPPPRRTSGQTGRRSTATGGGKSRRRKSPPPAQERRGRSKSGSGLLKFFLGVVVLGGLGYAAWHYRADWLPAAKERVGGLVPQSDSGRLADLYEEARREDSFQAWSRLKNEVDDPNDEYFVQANEALSRLAEERDVLRDDLTSEGGLLDSLQDGLGLAFAWNESVADEALYAIERLELLELDARHQNIVARFNRLQDAWKAFEAEDRAALVVLRRTAAHDFRPTIDKLLDRLQPASAGSERLDTLLARAEDYDTFEAWQELAEEAEGAASEELAARAGRRLAELGTERSASLAEVEETLAALHEGLSRDHSLDDRLVRDAQDRLDRLRSLEPTPRTKELDDELRELTRIGDAWRREDLARLERISASADGRARETSASLVEELRRRQEERFRLPEADPVQDLLARADRSRAALRLTRGDDPARDLYLEVLELDPANEAAARGLEQIAVYFLSQVPTDPERAGDAAEQALQTYAMLDEHSSVRTDSGGAEKVASIVVEAARSSIAEEQAEDLSRWVDLLGEIDASHPLLPDLRAELERLLAEPSPGSSAEALRAAGLETRGSEWVRVRDGATVVRVPGGTLRLGHSRGDRDEQPRSTVSVAPFLMDETEVTWAQFRRYVSAGPSRPSWQPSGDHPVVGVTWREAENYCRWAGARLPSEAEWEIAARGTAGREYPWGPIWQRGYVSGRGERADFGTEPVGRSSGDRTPEGLEDMSGNASEWVQDLHEGGGRLIRGGSFFDLRPGAGANSGEGLAGWDRSFAEEQARLPNVGFRCAMDLPRGLAD